MFDQTYGTATKGISVDITVRVDFAQLATWTPEQINAFMRGVALILSANTKPEVRDAD